MVPTIVRMNDRHQTKPYPLRMSDELRAKLEEEAKGMGRSLNAEILARLEASLTPVVERDFQKEFLGDMIFGSFQDEEDQALGDLDRTSVEGMVAWLRLVDAYREKRKQLEIMVDEAWAIFQKEKADKEAAKKRKSTKATKVK